MIDMKAIKHRLAKGLSPPAIARELRTSIPSLNFTPVITLARYANPRSRRQFSCAHCPGLNIMWSMPSRVRHPFERLVRWRMVAKVDSIGLLVRMLCQWLCCKPDEGVW